MGCTGSAATYLKHLTSALAGLFDDVAALPRVGHELSYRHLALGLVVNGPGAPKFLHLPIAVSDSCRIVYLIYVQATVRIATFERT
jgi:hypothetical protein